MLMRPNDRGADGYHPAQVLIGVRLGQQGGEHSFPGPVDRSVPQTAVTDRFRMSLAAGLVLGDLGRQCVPSAC